jgi:hypothetical protein
MNLNYVIPKYEVKIVSKIEKETYYKKLFHNYDDAIDVCNMVFNKLIDKNLYEKSVNIILNNKKEKLHYGD